MYINIDAVTISLNEINIMYLINLFTTVNILLNYTFHAEFFDDNNFVMKFIIINFHNSLNMSIYITSSCFLLF